MGYISILLQDPSLEMTVNSQFEGRQYPQLSSIIESQVQYYSMYRRKGKKLENCGIND